ncbi:MAG: hypothetical protein WCE21_00365 [Candidatus Babeliales bacterium]
MKRILLLLVASMAINIHAEPLTEALKEYHKTWNTLSDVLSGKGWELAPYIPKATAEEEKDLTSKIVDIIKKNSNNPFTALAKIQEYKKQKGITGELSETLFKTIDNAFLATYGVKTNTVAAVGALIADAKDIKNPGVLVNDTIENVYYESDKKTKTKFAQYIDAAINNAFGGMVGSFWATTYNNVKNNVAKNKVAAGDELIKDITTRIYEPGKKNKVNPFALAEAVYADSYNKAPSFTVFGDVSRHFNKQFTQDFSGLSLDAARQFNKDLAALYQTEGISTLYDLVKKNSPQITQLYYSDYPTNTQLSPYASAIDDRLNYTFNWGMAYRTGFKLPTYDTLYKEAEAKGELQPNLPPVE